jgi:hypothetical protein
MLNILIKLNQQNKPESPNRQMHYLKRSSRNHKLRREIIKCFLEHSDREKAQKMIKECDDSFKEENGLESKKTLLVTICYVRPRKLDSDNLIASLKHVIDSIADNIIPGLTFGRADGDPRLKFQCTQKAGNPKEYALEIKIQQIIERKETCAMLAL